MILSPKPTKQDWHPSSLLAYAAVPNSQDDIDSTTSEVKSTTETETDFYDYGLTSRKYALVGVACTSIISCSFIIAGIVIVATYRATNGAFQFQSDPEVLGLAMNLIVTLCTESTGLVHGISLRYALASESRLRFNTNLRLLTAARGWRNPNGSLLNGIMAVLLIISYTSASLVILSFDGMLRMPDSSGYRGSWEGLIYVCISGPPLIVLGIALLLQVVISLSGMWAVKILTWSPSPFDLTAALIHHTQLIPIQFRCMRGISESDVYGSPAKPSEKQSSPWHAHGSIRKVVHFLWGLVVACAGWAALVMLIGSLPLGTLFIDSNSLAVPIPARCSKLVSWTFPLSGDVTFQWWILSIAIVALAQGLLTLGLHCSELIVNVIGDERRWRSATSRKGLRMNNNPLMQFFSNPFGLVLFVAKPVLHWMFGLAFSFSSEPDSDFRPSKIVMFMCANQIFDLFLALFIFACFVTLIALRRPRGPQPAAYGHLQTLANLIDEWSPVMWWGHKEDGIPYCHAGTSDHSLPPVKMDCTYAGSSGFHPSISPSGCDFQAYN